MSPPDPDSRTRRTPITVLVVAEQPSLERIEAILGDADRLEVRTASTVSDALDRLADVDCLVLVPSVSDAKATAVVDRLRQRLPDLPIVVLDDESAPASLPADAAGSRQWVDHVVVDPERSDSVLLERLGRRVRSLVERRRLAALSRRSLASVELAKDAIAIVGVDDEIEFANHSYAVQFGYDRAELRGVPWQQLFTDDTVDRLESTAIPTAAEGWRWTGTCTARRSTGKTFTAQVRLGGLEDGSLVFVVDGV
ncbi:PAS domain S-box protein [Halopiger djelfimassiliensis]|uniref:PAS domain S-box protein n=1 Tax=Halopiger djelfimassiliensis TaxID=1293047 RepID=UPI000A5E6075|nr:PAS domain S-box protein [Halopiger djelfimassiliensis]